MKQIQMSANRVNSKQFARRDCTDDLCNKFWEEHKQYFEWLMNKYFVWEYDPYLQQKVAKYLKDR